MKRILVTGANGFIGHPTVTLLSNAGYEVHVITKSNSQNLNKICSLDNKITCYQCDIFNNSKVSELIKVISPQYLLHLAWDVTPGKYWNSVNNTDWVVASINLVKEFVSNGGVHLIAAGTCAEYDWSYNGAFNEESSPCAPRSLYGASKYGLYLILDKLCQQLGIRFAYGRIFYPFGPYEHISRLIPSVINASLSNEPVLCTHGLQERDFIYVEDVADIFYSMIDSAFSGAVNLGRGEGISIQAIVNQIVTLLEVEVDVQFGKIDTPADDPPKLIAGIKKLSSLLNWSPKYTIKDGLERTILWWKNLRMQHH